jgi:hypothetical protein
VELLARAWQAAKGQPDLNSDPSGLGGYIVLLDGLRNKYATLGNQQRKPAFKFRTSEEFGPFILLLSNKDF